MQKDEPVEFLKGVGVKKKKKPLVMRDLDQASAIQQSSDEFAALVYTTKYTSHNTIASVPNSGPMPTHVIDGTQLILLSAA